MEKLSSGSGLLGWCNAVRNKVKDGTMAEMPDDLRFSADSPRRDRPSMDGLLFYIVVGYANQVICNSKNQTMEYQRYIVL